MHQIRRPRTAFCCSLLCILSSRTDNCVEALDKSRESKKETQTVVDAAHSVVDDGLGAHLMMGALLRSCGPLIPRNIVSIDKGRLRPEPWSTLPAMVTADTYGVLGPEKKNVSGFFRVLSVCPPFFLLPSRFLSFAS